MTDHGNTPPRGLARLVDRLQRLPQLGVFLGALVISVAALFAPGVIGAVLVGLLAAGVALLLMATWQRDAPGARAMRLLVLGVLVVIAVGKLL